MSNIKIINHISLQYYIKHKIVTDTYLVRTNQTPKLYIYLKTKIQLQFKNRSKISLGIEVKLISSLVQIQEYNNQRGSNAIAGGGAADFLR